MTTPNPEPCVGNLSISGFTTAADYIAAGGKVFSATLARDIPTDEQLNEVSRLVDQTQFVPIVDEVVRQPVIAEPRNNRRPYKADIRTLAEEQLVLSAAEQIELREQDALKDYALRIAGLVVTRAERSRNRWRIACLVVAVVGVVGWLW